MHLEDFVGFIGSETTYHYCSISYVSGTTRMLSTIFQALFVGGARVDLSFPFVLYLGGA